MTLRTILDIYLGCLSHFQQVVSLKKTTNYQLQESALFLKSLLYYLVEFEGIFFQQHKFFWWASHNLTLTQNVGMHWQLALNYCHFQTVKQTYQKGEYLCIFFVDWTPRQILFFGLRAGLNFRGIPHFCIGVGAKAYGQVNITNSMLTNFSFVLEKIRILHS